MATSQKICASCNGEAGVEQRPLVLVGNVSGSTLTIWLCLDCEQQVRSAYGAKLKASAALALASGRKRKRGGRRPIAKNLKLVRLAKRLALSPGSDGRKKSRRALAEELHRKGYRFAPGRPYSTLAVKSLLDAPDPPPSWADLLRPPQVLLYR